MTLVSIEISPIVVTPDDVDMLQDLVVAAVNDAMRGMNDMAQAHIDAATGGMNLPMM
jgi:DNA-binding protein YbaB